jgi:putative ABC transport system permease protein
MFWLVRQIARRAPGRLLLGAVAAALPVATLAATTLFIADSTRAMTAVALQPVQVEYRALATTLNVDVDRVATQLRGVQGVRAVDVFGAANVVVTAPDASNRVSARLIAVEPAYFTHHGWVRPQGDVGNGALINGAIAVSPGFERASQVRIDLAGDFPPVNLTLPVAGRIDTRDAQTTWSAIPYGEVQGDVAEVPRMIVVDYAAFQQAILPVALKTLGPQTAVTNPGLTDLPQASVEAHVAVDHQAYPSNPSDAARWSGQMRRVLERSAPGDIIAADNAAEPLSEAAVDATNAKILFILLGLPGVLVSAALGIAAASALTESHRREDALLRLRGASEPQLVRLAVQEGVVVTAIGVVIGLLAAVLLVSAVVRHVLWWTVDLATAIMIVIAAAVAGALTTALRLVLLVRASRRPSLISDRRLLPGRWAPRWLRGRLDVVAVVVGLLILVGNFFAGGLRPNPIEGQALALSFYVLLAPLALWLGCTLLIVRGLLHYLRRVTAPDAARPLTTWPATAGRWLGRRPARAAVALIMGALAVAFGTEVAAFVATYQTAKQDDAQVAAGSELRITPLTDPPAQLPDLSSSVAAITAIRTVPARAGSDRKTIMALDPATYEPATSPEPMITDGGGVADLAGDPTGVLLSQEIAADFEIGVGDTFPVTIYPDDLDLSQKLSLHVVGIYRAIPPADPPTEMVMSIASIPPPVLAPEFYLARPHAETSAVDAATVLRQQLPASAFTVTTAQDRVRASQRSLTALNLAGLSTIESAFAALIAALGVAVLGAFLVMERRREFAILATIGTGNRDMLVGTAVEGAAAVLGSLVIGIPVGLALALLAVRVLGGFFVLPPPLLSVPIVDITALVALVLLTTGAAFFIALERLRRSNLAGLLRES